MTTMVVSEYNHLRHKLTPVVKLANLSIMKADQKSLFDSSNAVDVSSVVMLISCVDCMKGDLRVLNIKLIIRDNEKRWLQLTGL